MSMAGGEGLIESLFFGFESARLAIRLDARGGPFREPPRSVDAVRVAFYSPEGYELRIANLSDRKPERQLTVPGQACPGAAVEVAADLIFEAAIPLENLNVATEDLIQFFVELHAGRLLAERVPTEGTIETAVPGEDYEMIMGRLEGQAEHGRAARRGRTCRICGKTRSLDAG